MLSVDQLEDKLIDLAFAEDIGDGDHTTLCCIPEDAMGKSHLLIKEDGVLAGVEMAKKVFARFDPTMKVEVLLQDGTHVKKGDIAMIVEGKTRYDMMEFVIKQNSNQLSEEGAMNLLNGVSQAETPGNPTSHTQWSVVYNLSQRKATVCVNRDYKNKFTFYAK